MKQRSLAKMIILFVITLGIYRFYWLVKTRQELKEKTGIAIPSIWLYLIPYLFLIFSFVGLIVTTVVSEIDYQQAFEACEQNAPSSIATTGIDDYCREQVGEQAEVSTLGYVSLGAFYIGALVISPLIGWWYWKYAQAVEQVTTQKMSFAVSMLIILAVPDGFDMLIVQDSFNKVATTK